MSTRGTFSAQIRPTQPCRRSFFGNPQMRASGARGEAPQHERTGGPFEAVAGSLVQRRQNARTSIVVSAWQSLQGLCLDRTTGDGEDTTMRIRINKRNEHRRCCEPARPYGALDQPMFPPRAIESRHASQRTQPAFVQYLREAAPCQRGPPALCNRRLSARQGSVQVTQGGHARVVDKVGVDELGNKVRITLQSCVLHPFFENEKYKEDGKSEREQEFV